MMEVLNLFKYRLIRKSLIPLLATHLVVLLYNLIFFNRYFPITEGWFSVYAEQMRRGQLPYLDFHLVLPPLYPATLELFIYVFGSDLIYLRILGIVLVLAITHVMYRLMSLLFPFHIASMTTIAGIIYYQSGTAHITYDFIQFFTLYSLLSTYFICKHCSPSNEGNWRGISNKFSYLFIAGVFCALALLTKQSNGVVLLLSLMATVIFINLKKNFAVQLKQILPFLLGILLPLAILVGWLYKNGAIHSFVEQTLIGASKSKGSMEAILFGWIPRIINMDQIAKFIFAAMLIYGIGYKYFVSSICYLDDSRRVEYDIKSLLIISFSILIAGILALFVPYIDVDLSMQILRNQYLVFSFYSIIIFVLITTILFILLYLVSLFFSEKTFSYNIYVFIISMTSFALLLGTATSGGIAEVGSFIGLSVVLGFLIYQNSALRFGNHFFIVFAFLLIVFCAARKYTSPYSWWWLNEADIRTANVQPDVPLLHGFYLSKTSSSVIENVTNLLKQHSASGEDILTFPNIPLFYLLSDKMPKRFILIHWYDVISDGLAVAEADRITRTKPKIIVYLRLREEVALGHETLFRGGKRSGQRDIIDAIEKLVNNGDYILERSFKMPEGNTLDIWIMKE